MIGCLGLVEHYFKPGTLSGIYTRVTWQNKEIWQPSLWPLHDEVEECIRNIVIHYCDERAQKLINSNSHLEVPKYAFVNKIDVYVYENELWRDVVYQRVNVLIYKDKQCDAMKVNTLHFQYDAK